MSEETYYTALGVAETATGDEIKSSYRSLLKRIHPDTVSTLSEETRRRAEEATREMNEAYSVLSDPRKRAEYDFHLAEQRSARVANLAASPQSWAARVENPNGGASSDATLTHKRRRRRRKHRSHSGRYSSQREHAKSLFRPVSFVDWVVLFGYFVIAVVLLAIAAVIISSASEGAEDGLAPSVNHHCARFAAMNGAGYGDRTRDIELGKLAFYR